MSDIDVLEFGTIDVFYIAWQVRSQIYFLHDMSPELDRIHWSKKQKGSFYFYTEKEAAKHLRLIKRTRRGVAVIHGEIDVIDDLLDFVL